MRGRPSHSVTHRMRWWCVGAPPLPCYRTASNRSISIRYALRSGRPPLLMCAHVESGGYGLGGRCNCNATARCATALRPPWWANTYLLQRRPTFVWWTLRRQRSRLISSAPARPPSVRLSASSPGTVVGRWVTERVWGGRSGAGGGGRMRVVSTALQHVLREKGMATC